MLILNISAREWLATFVTLSPYHARGDRKSRAALGRRQYKCFGYISAAIVAPLGLIESPRWPGRSKWQKANYLSRVKYLYSSNENAQSSLISQSSLLTEDSRNMAFRLLAMQLSKISRNIKFAAISPYRTTASRR